MGYFCYMISRNNLKFLPNGKVLISSEQPKKKRKNEEDKIQEQLGEYIRRKYPDVIFTSESSGVRVTKWVAVHMKKCRSGRSLPDVIILEPRKGYHGCCIELKTEKAEIYKKDGTLRKNEHVEGQEDTLNYLKEKGYFTSFAIGLDHAITLVDFYLG